MDRATRRRGDVPILTSMFERADVLLRWLLERGIVDELDVCPFPVVVGDGLPLFPERDQTHDLTLVESRSTPGGVTVLTYRRTGRLTFGTAP